MSSTPIREQAEQQLEQTAQAAGDPSPEELQQELQVYQIELEMQNEALRQSQIALEESRDRYLDLYEFAPVAYLTLTRSGLIAAANLTAAHMLGFDRQNLLNRRFDSFIANGDREHWRHQFLAAWHRESKQQATLALMRGDRPCCVAHVDCLRIEGHDGPPTLRITLTDISARLQAERAERESHALGIAILNAVPAAIAVLDRSGTIISVNTAWRRYVREIVGVHDQAAADIDIGGKYQMVCAGVGDDSREGSTAYRGIKAVMDGKLPMFTLEYPCATPRQPHWFSMTVTPLGMAGGGVVVAHRDITERKWAVAALRESEQRFRLALRNAPVSVAVQDRDLRYIWAYNQRTARPEEIIGHFDADLFSPEQAAHFDQIKRRVLDEGVELSERLWVDRPGGRIFLDIYWEPIRDEDGRVVGVGSATVNLTPTKLAEEALQASKTTLEAALASMSDAVFISDVEGRLIHFNEAFASFHRFQNKYECARTLVEYPAIIEVYSDSGELLPLDHWALPQALRGETAVGAEFTLRRKDTGETWIGSYNYAPIRDQGGVIVGAVVSARDITDLKRAEQALVKQEAQYRAVIETAADGVWVIDDTGHFIVVNDSYVRRSGYSREELMTMCIADLEAAESPDEVLAHMEKIQRNGSDLFETHHRARNGEIWPVEVNVTYSAAAGGLRTSFLRDISERKRAEAHLQALSDEMEQVMRHHVARQTVAAIAHELNQPLNAIASYSDAALHLLRAGNPRPERLLHALESCSQQAQRAGKVVRELLDFVSHGQVTTTAVDLNELVRGAIGKLGGEQIDPVRPRLDLEPGLSLVRADPLQVEKVLANLVRNGVEAMRGAGVPGKDISVSVRTHGEGTMALVTVRDNGPGIDEQHLHRIFDPFFTTKPKGLGMGLAISRAIIEAHGGQLWVESRPGAGAAFHFTLPFLS